MSVISARAVAHATVAKSKMGFELELSSVMASPTGS
jgi:hypothetical protein